MEAEPIYLLTSRAEGLPRKNVKDLHFIGKKVEIQKCHVNCQPVLEVIGLK